MRKRVRGRVRGLSPRIETPHPTRDFVARHLLPQGEKGRMVPHRPSIAEIIHCFMASVARKFDRRVLNACGRALALRHRHQQVAAPRHRDADGAVLRAIGHPQDHRPGSSGHIGDANHLARRQRHEPFADQVEIGDAVDFVVIGDAAVAIAEADLRPHVDLDVVAARSSTATKRAPCGPAVARKRPRDLPPVRDLRPRVLIGRNARQGADSQNRNHDDRQATHRSRPYGRPATARAAPVSCRICKPVLARSTM